MGTICSDHGWMFLSSSCGSPREDGPVPVDIVDLNLIWIDANDRAILTMEALDMPIELPSWCLDEAEVIFVKITACGELGTWELGQRMKEETI